ncbi:MAG: hypothetical protein U5K33_11375 [Halofilum sp. (in: g-proteobacteria)]|nr:hypothetical protein [Halofilum sp. (in: g-proteobacteria)]
MPAVASQEPAYVVYHAMLLFSAPAGYRRLPCLAAVGAFLRQQTHGIGATNAVRACLRQTRTYPAFSATLHELLSPPVRAGFQLADW